MGTDYAPLLSNFFYTPMSLSLYKNLSTIEDKCCNKVSLKRSLRKLTLFRYVTERYFLSSVIEKSLLMESS
jgi:hypothetical protein